MERQKPGEKPAKSGEYVERGKRGGHVPNPRQVTIEPGDPKLPPTQAPGRTWERVSPPEKNS
ncbi:MAG: YjzC family protein [Cyanobacteria bacterium J06638_20]